MSRARGRVWAILAAAVVLVGGGGAAGSISSTQSAWTDTTIVSAVATGGTWVAPSAVGCTAMNADGSVKNGGYCSVTSVSVEAEWGSTGSRTRNYTAKFRTNAGNGYIQFTVDLSAAGGAYSWNTAGLVAPSQQAIPTNGWTCAQLPLLTAKTPTNWGWGNSSSIFFQVAEDRTSTGVTCG